MEGLGVGEVVPMAVRVPFLDVYRGHWFAVPFVQQPSGSIWWCSIMASFRDLLMVDWLK